MEIDLKEALADRLSASSYLIFTMLMVAYTKSEWCKKTAEVWEPVESKASRLTKSE